MANRSVLQAALVDIGSMIQHVIWHMLIVGRTYRRWENFQIAIILDWDPMVGTQPLGRIAVGFPKTNIYVFSYTLKNLWVENGSLLESVNGLECLKMMPPRMTPASVDLVSGGVW